MTRCPPPAVNLPKAFIRLPELTERCGLGPRSDAATSTEEKISFGALDAGREASDLQDGTNTFSIGADDGMDDFDEKKPSITVVIHDPSIQTTVLERFGQAIAEDFVVQSVSTRARAGSRLDRNTPTVVHYRLESAQPAEKVQQQVLSDWDPVIRAHCELLDGLDVPNGEKAIAIALHQHWTDELRTRFGEYANPGTVRRWLAEHRRQKAGLPSLRPRRQAPAEARRIARALRRHHAIRVKASGITMRDGYAEVLQDIHRVRQGEHHLYAGQAVPRFSYETFRRECRQVRSGGRDQTKARRR